MKPNQTKPSQTKPNQDRSYTVPAVQGGSEGRGRAGLELRGQRLGVLSLPGGRHFKIFKERYRNTDKEKLRQIMLRNIRIGLIYLFSELGVRGFFAPTRHYCKKKNTAELASSRLIRTNIWQIKNHVIFYGGMLGSYFSHLFKAFFYFLH